MDGADAPGAGLITLASYLKARHGFWTAVLRLVPALAVASALTGCVKSGGEAALDTYSARLERPLGEAIADAPSEATPRPPRAEALRIPVPRSSLDGLDFLRLRGCALQNTVARRNSSLGRVAPPSQRLLLELEFLLHVPACILLQREKGNEELAAVLEEAQRQKQEQLPDRIFNATLGGIEYRDFWRAPTQLGDYPASTGSQVITALESVNRDVALWLGGDYRADGARFELALSAIARGDGGELLSALALQAQRLGAADDAIERRVARGDLCAAGRVPEAAPILRTVVQKFFLGTVQPWSAALNQRYHALLDPIRELEMALGSALPEDYDIWKRQRDSALESSRAAPSTHVRRLQALLGPCYPEYSREPPAAEDL